MYNDNYFSHLTLEIRILILVIVVDYSVISSCRNSGGLDCPNQ